MTVFIHNVMSNDRWLEKQKLLRLKNRVCVRACVHLFPFKWT